MIRHCARYIISLIVETIRFKCDCITEDGRLIVKLTENRIVLRDLSNYNIYILISRSETSIEVEHDLSFPTSEAQSYDKTKHRITFCNEENNYDTDDKK